MRLMEEYAAALPLVPTRTILQNLLYCQKLISLSTPGCICNFIKIISSPRYRVERLVWGMIPSTHPIHETRHTGLTMLLMIKSDYRRLSAIMGS